MISMIVLVVILAEYIRTDDFQFNHLKPEATCSLKIFHVMVKNHLFS